nr:MAG TPA: hypothetical protein [Caudoviricetes sp.]
MSKRSERIKVAPLMLSKVFTSGHSKAGQPTRFKEQLMDGTKKHTIRGNYQYWAKKAEQINAGKMVLSIRQWTGRPYNSEQEEIMQLHTLRVQAISINITDATPMVGVYGDTDKLLSAEEIEKMARNDGLCVEDWLEWMCPKGKPFAGAILHFTNELNY